MSMKYGDLAKYRHAGVMMLKEPALSTLRAGGNPQQASIAVRRSTEESQRVISQVTGENLLQLIRDDAGDGLWVPYLAQKTVYGFLSGAQTWAASGPYSGCYFEVGRIDGRIYVAHISCEMKNDPNVAAWREAPEMARKEVLFSKKIGMAAEFPLGTTNAATIVFADLAGGRVAATRVDVQTRSAGGMSGPIFGVEEITSDAY
ncbi:MAG: hypothetical protein KGL18_17965 [Burkholderiales bacterium]|nr:hypothetical protein [Burkholderiales bacterium]MDE1927364.1 hypothetical protein [Burkholderiales bacterium]MDE2159003.1 hypothetical protein [Burkholderiales bacterium]MDE2504854.1 hypothetical protein [Burkholderiales bacterium]